MFCPVCLIIFGRHGRMPNSTRIIQELRKGVQMIPQGSCPRLTQVNRVLFVMLALLSFAAALLAQTTVGTGSLVGTVTDPSGAVVNGAKVTITNSATGQAINATSNQSGTYNSGALTPGNYKVQVASQGFRTVN